MPAAPATRAEIKRAVEAAKDLGLPVSGISVTKDGTVTVHTEKEKAANLDNDAQIIKPAPKQWAKR